jgi:hypothetical protein
VVTDVPDAATALAQAVGALVAALIGYFLGKRRA